jgi:outer membrane biosynthesis protein TonB
LHPKDALRIFRDAGRPLVARADGVSDMYRVIAIAATLFLAACSSNSDFFKSHPDWFKTGPTLETVRFESTPPGAEAKTSLGKSCRTPCALALAPDQPFTVAFTLNGFQPDTENVQPVSMGDGSFKLKPNPVQAVLTPVAPPKKMRKRRRRTVHHKRAVKHAAPKPKPKPAPKAAPKPAPAPAPAAPPPPQRAPSPWPAPTPQQ